MLWACSSDFHYIDSSDNPIKNAFTIIELLVVIVVVGILASITLVSYSGIQQGAKNASVKSDLTNAATLMNMDYTTNGVMSSTLPSGVKVSSGNALSLSSTGSLSTFCINATNTTTNSFMYYDSSYGGVQTGNCTGSTIYNSEVGIKPTMVTDDSFSNISGSGWRISLSTGGGVTLTTRPGTSSDPINNKPVLVLTNSTSKTETWSVLETGVPWADFHLNSVYNTSYYVRQIGGFSGPINTIAVIDGAGTNVTFGSSASPAITSSWQKITSTKTAVKDGTSNNLLYLYLNNAQFVNAGWSLEFQDPQITLQ